MSSTLTDLDKLHLNEVAVTMDWALIATVMKAINWRWYHVPGRTPNAGEVRDQALGYLADCIRYARESANGCTTICGGGLECTAAIYNEDTESPDEVLGLSCAFVLTSTDSSGQSDGRSVSRQSYD